MSHTAPSTFIDLFSMDDFRGVEIDLFDASVFAGNFSAVNLPELVGGIMWNKHLLGVDGTISIVPAGMFLIIR